MRGSTTKKIIWTVASLVLLLVLAGGALLAYNLWPRQVDPPLYGELELALPPALGPIAWDLIPKGGDPRPSFPRNLDVAGEFDALIPEGVDSKGEVIRFWNEAGKMMPALHDMLEKENEALSAYRKILDGPPLIDRDPIGLSEQKARVLYLLDLHKLGIAYVGERFMSGDTEKAFGFLLTMIQQDMQWTYSARSLLGQLTSLTCFKTDLDMALLIRYRTKPQRWDSLTAILSGMDWSKINLRRNLVYEYSSMVKMIDAVVPPTLKRSNWFSRATFNAALLRRDLNKFFKGIETFVKNPSAIKPSDIARFDEEVRRKTKESLWWAVNPGGKAVYGLVVFNPLEEWKTIATLKQQSYDLYKKITGFQDEVSPSAPLATPSEASASPTPSSETQAHPEAEAEAPNPPSAESRPGAEIPAQ